MPWTQITVTLPIKPGTTHEEDLAVVWALMRESTNNEVKEKGNGDLTWTLWGSDEYLKWLNIDPEKTKPVDKFVHPVLYETGARKRTLLGNKLKKARKSGDVYAAQRLECELEEYEAAQAAKAAGATTRHPSGMDYHWSCYNECLVTFRNKQKRKVANELQLTVKIRTSYLGCGDPKDHNGYLGGGCSASEGLLDPESRIYKLLQNVGM